mgnify:CR=1 FL=1
MVQDLGKAVTAAFVADGLVATERHNTPAACPKSYINPVVFAAWRAGYPQGLGRDDKAALRFLKAQARRPRR